MWSGKGTTIDSRQPVLNLVCLKLTEHIFLATIISNPRIFHDPVLVLM